MLASLSTRCSIVSPNYLSTSILWLLEYFLTFSVFVITLYLVLDILFLRINLMTFFPYYTGKQIIYSIFPHICPGVRKRLHNKSINWILKRLIDIAIRNTLTIHKTLRGSTGKFFTLIDLSSWGEHMILNVLPDKMAFIIQYWNNQYLYVEIRAMYDISQRYIYYHGTSTYIKIVLDK